MECTCIRHTELPHTSRLFADLVYHPDRLRRFYPLLPDGLQTYERSASAIQMAPEHRAALVAALAVQNPGSASLEALARPDTVAVVTGQQIGLFSGPAYTIYKALTAVKLARDLTARGISAVPVFWLATEDHDFAEVNHTWVFDTRHQPVRLEMNSPASNQPVGGIALAQPPLEELARALDGMPFAGEVAGLVAQAYSSGRTMGEAFRSLLRRLLEGYDLLHVDPMAPEIRVLAAPAIRRSLASHAELTGAVLERNAELTAAGYHAQIHVEDHTSFVFLLENGRRLTLRRSGRDFVQNGRRFTTEELMERAAELSPNALLRPVIQDSILPTVAYVGGPAELAYLAQAAVVYPRVIGRMPVPVSRRGFTILGPRERKLMARYQVGPADCFQGEEALRQRMAARLIPPALRASLSQTRESVAEAAGRLYRTLEEFDPSLASALERSRRKIEYQVSKIERKAGREAARREQRADEDAASFYNLIYPHRHLQERLYSILPFLATHGTDLIEGIYEHVRLECPDHQLLVV